MPVNPPPSLFNQAYLPSLDGLRFFAAMCVLFTRAQGGGKSDSSTDSSLLISDCDLTRHSNAEFGIWKNSLLGWTDFTVSYDGDLYSPTGSTLLPPIVVLA